MRHRAKKVNRLRQFATANTLQILVINIEAFRKNFTGTEAEQRSNVIYKESDKLSGRQPIEFVQATHHNVYNLVYRLDPVSAFQRKLVKQIKVTTASSSGSANDAFVRVEDIDNKKGPRARLRIHVQMAGGPKERTVTVKLGDDLFRKSNERAIYAKAMSCRKATPFPAASMDKERLLSLEEPLRFIFSHSALREGWDNPNVFQICTLNEAQNLVKKRQEIGRGLRLPVDQAGRRVFDESVNILEVMANESHEEFARALQTEYEEDCGFTFGKVPLRARQADAGHRR